MSGQRNKNYAAQSKSRFSLHDGHQWIVISNSFVLTVPHRLGTQEAKRRIVEQIELLQDCIDKLAYSEANWNGEIANLRIVAFGQTVRRQNI
jgi:hypothetical protein